VKRAPPCNWRSAAVKATEQTTEVSDESAITLIQPALTSIPPRVLVVDDDEIALQRLSDLVAAAGYEVATVSSGAAALSSLRTEFAPIVILDRSMPGMDGLELCRAIREGEYPGYVYIMLCTAHDSEEEILGGLRAGADDYLSKRASGTQLIARLATARRIIALEQSLKHVIEERRRMAMTDALTGCYNRRYFMNHLRRELKRAGRSSRELALAVLDIDHFKRINDRFGHAAGDAVLVEFAQRLNDALPRETDWCARLGGEEFAVVLPETHLQGARVVAEAMRAAVATVPMRTAAGPVDVTVSVGISSVGVFTDRGAATVEQLLRRADDCLYFSKRSGRDRVTIDGEANVDKPLKTVLYVDDDPDIREIVQMSLSLDGQLKVLTSDGGERALLKMRVEHPDLVVLDVMMPGMDGPTLLKRMREDPGLAQIPVIFMTAKATAEETERFRELSAIGVIAKPFDPMALGTRVRALWEAK
jgi:two-component system cell cycle response regulator